MRGRFRPIEGLILAAIAVFGIGAGHVLDYVLVVPVGGERHELLAHTGHGYLTPGLAIGAALAAVAALATFLLGVRGGLNGSGRQPSLRSQAALLASAQVLAFVGLEVGERVVVGAPLSDLVGPILALGVAIQVALGVAGAFVLTLISRAAEAIGHALASRRRRIEWRPVVLRPASWDIPVPVRPDGTTPARAPPVLLA